MESYSDSSDDGSSSDNFSNYSSDDEFEFSSDISEPYDPDGIESVDDQAGCCH